jgi:hypothetical protein
MPNTCVVSGSFAQHGKPAQGLVRFTPNRLWVMQDRITWACLAPEVRLDSDGAFVAQVTATDTDAILWSYNICTPAGCFVVYVPWSEVGWSLRELIRGHSVGKSSSQR